MLLNQDKTHSDISHRDYVDGKRKGFLGINTRSRRYDYKVIVLSPTRLMFVPNSEIYADRFDTEINYFPDVKKLNKS